MQSSKLYNYTVYYNNSEEYHHLKQEIFTQDLYYFETENPQPIIIDAGAYIGLSTLYFKYLFPGAQIIAIEPNPQAIEILNKNIFENQLENITVIQAALSNSQQQTKLQLDNSSDKWFSTASIHTGAWSGTQKTSAIPVQSHTLSEFITQPVDFLKLDIEGAEQSVLLTAKNSLQLVTEIHIEFHPHASQNIDTILSFLEETHSIEVYSGTKLVPKNKLQKTKGLLQIRCHKKKN